MQFRPHSPFAALESLFFYLDGINGTHAHVDSHDGPGGLHPPLNHKDLASNTGLFVG
jgi:hypothetical protein